MLADAEVTRKAGFHRGSVLDHSMDILVSAVVVVVVAGPILVTNRGLNGDVTNTMWLGTAMSHSLANGLPPTFFVSTGTTVTSTTTHGGVFYPIFSFYGSSLYVILGILTLWLGGSASAALAVLVVLAIAAAYGGTLWISRQCGLRGWLSYVPGLVVVTAPYYLTDLYGRGDVPEFVAVSMIPLVVASAGHLVRATSWTPGPTILLVLSVIVFTGSHNISLLWGTLIGMATLALLGVMIRPRPLPTKRLCSVAGVIILATMVNGWFLLPDAAFSGTTLASTSAALSVTFFDNWRLILNPLRSVPSESTSPALYVQAPVWFLAWSLGFWVLARIESSSSTLRRAWTALALVLVAVLLLAAETSLWKFVPAGLKVIQFPYRLNGFALLLIAGLVLVSLLALQRALGGSRQARLIPTVLVASLVAVIAISTILGIRQIAQPCRPGPGGCAISRAAGLTGTTIHVLPKSWSPVDLFTNSTEPVLPVAPGRSYNFSPDLVDPHGDRLVATVRPPGGTQPFLTNIEGGPQLVSVGGGIERLGRNQNGYAVVRRVKSGDGPIRVVIQAAAIRPLGQDVGSAFWGWLALGCFSRCRSATFGGTGDDLPTTATPQSGQSRGTSNGVGRARSLVLPEVAHRESCDVDASMSDDPALSSCCSSTTPSPAA